MTTLREIAAEIDVPESTLRLYRDEFEEFLPAMGEGRRRRYGDEAYVRLHQIVTWRRAGWGSAQVRDALAREIKPVAQVRRRNTEERLDELAVLLRAQGSELALLRVETGALRAEVRRLTEILRADIPPTLEQALEVR